jgi:metal-responsive CopG/Arc/MetJ family transcriptional regulator
MGRYGKRIQIILPETFLKDIDKIAQSCLMSRSDYIRLALMEKMKKSSLVEPPQPWTPPFDPTDPAFEE